LSLLDAIKNGDLAAVEQILDNEPGAASSRDESGVSVVMTALYYRKTEISAALLAADPVLDGFDAAALGRLGGLPAEPGGRSSDGFTHLHLACFFGHDEAAAVLLERGADVNAVADTTSRVSPLHSATAAGSLAAITLLLEAGATVDAQQEGGWTALMAAALHGRVDLVRVLLAAGADSRLKGQDGRDALAMATENGDPELLALF